jgi:peptide/nickel transport system substrate-binding protein
MRRLKQTLLAASVAAVLPLAQAAAAPAADTIVIGMSADASTFDPAQIASRDNSNIADHIFGSLYDVSSEGKIEPQMAESFTVSDDGLSYTFKMKDGLACEDGEALTAEDVAYSFTRAADPKNAFTGNTPGFIFSAINFKSAEVVDKLNVKINIGTKSPIALGLLTEVFLHCKDSYEKMSLEQAASKPVASGAYRLVKWDRGSQVVLERIKDTGGTFKNIVWRIIPEASTRSAELIAGNVDIVTNVAPDQIGAVDTSGTAAVKSVQGTRRMYVGFNQRKEFASTPGGAAIQKADVRKALQYAVDVPSICTQLLNFDCTRATGPVNPPNDNKSLTPYAYDPAMAEKLLDEAGYPRGKDGVRFEIKMQAPRGRYLNDANVALAVGQFLTDVGVKTDVETLDWASVYTPLVRKHDAGPLFFLGTGGALWSAIYDLTDFAEVKSSTNYTDWSDPDFFGGWKDIENAKTADEQVAVVNRMLKVFYEKGPWLLMYFQPDFYGVSKRVDFQPRRDERLHVFDTKLTK